MTNEDIIRRVKEILIERKAKSGMSIPALWAIFSSDGSLPGSDIDERGFTNIVKREYSSKNGELEKSNKNEKKTGRIQVRIKFQGPSMARRVGIPEGEASDSATVGAAGEIAVLSELTFRGFNATKMPVDKGIDVVAEKENKFYYYQVKTAHLKENRVAHFEIKRSSFDRVYGHNVSYVLLVRTPERKMIYVVLPQAKIEELMHKQIIEPSQENININIHYDSVPSIIRGNREENLDFYVEKFI